MNPTHIFVRMPTHANNIEITAHNAARSICALHDVEQGAEMPPAADFRSLLVNFLNPKWIPPAGRDTLCLNIHPAPPKYPGVGGITRALLDAPTFGTIAYGVTVHEVDATYDTGRILGVWPCTLVQNMTLPTAHRCVLGACVTALNDVLTAFRLNEKLPAHVCEFDDWATENYMRRDQFEAEYLTTELPSVTPLGPRLQATVYPGRPGPYLMYGGHKYKVERE